MSWKETLATKFGTRSKAAALLHSHWKKIEPREAKKVDPRSLANRIGKLEREGDRTGWWEDRPRLADLLADLLELDRNEIFGRAPPLAGELTFPEFPRFPALRSDEAPCRWREPRDALRIVRQQLDAQRDAWVLAPPGAGKSLVVRYLQARYAGEVVAISVQSLSAALHEASSSHVPLVVEIEEAEPERDLVALRGLTSRPTTTIVLAPFPCPETTWLGHEDRTGLSDSGWTTVDATPGGAWRTAMLDWIDARLEDTDTKLSKAHVLEWLRRHDPTCRMIATPGDLLALCSDFDVHGPTDEPFVARASRWLDGVATVMLPREAPPTWRNRIAVSTYRQLASAHLRDIANAFDSCSGTVWAGLVPAAVRPAAAEDGPGAAVVVGYLREAGLLRGASEGLVLHPRWVAHALATDELALDGASVHEWGSLAADESRQPIIDDMLDGLPDAKLRRLLSDIAKHGAPKSLAAVASIEAVVAAAGRRLAGGGLRLSDTDAATMHTLMRHQLASLGERDVSGHGRHPLTRPRLDEWFATGWAVSLRVPPPPGANEQDDVTWEIPGWARHLVLASAKKHVFPTTHHVPWGASAGEQRVAELAIELVGRLEPGEVPEDVPRLLLPALFLSPRLWGLGPHHLRRIGGSWDEQFLGERASELPAEHRVALADRLWSLAAQGPEPDAPLPVAERLAAIRERNRGLLAFVAASVSAEEVARTAHVHGIHWRSAGASTFVESDPLELLELPTDVRHAALRGWLSGAAARGSRFDEARELLVLLDSDDLEVALELARAEDGHIAGEFTDFVWRTAPGRAHEAARDALANKLPSAPGWFHAAPRKALLSLTELVSNRTPVPNWVRRWARQRMLDGGLAAEKLFTLARAPADSGSHASLRPRRR